MRGFALARSGLIKISSLLLNRRPLHRNPKERLGSFGDIGMGESKRHLSPQPPPSLEIEKYLKLGTIFETCEDEQTLDTGTAGHFKLQRGK